MERNLSNKNLTFKLSTVLALLVLIAAICYMSQLIYATEVCIDHGFESGVVTLTGRRWCIMSDYDPEAGHFDLDFILNNR